MNYLTVENISKSYGELTLFENISFSVHKDQKIAFVAKNGTGKTSILNILSGEDEADSGNVVYRKDINAQLNFIDITFNVPGNIPSGMYLLELESNNGRKEKQPLMIR